MRASGTKPEICPVTANSGSAMIWRAVDAAMVVGVGILGLLMAHHPMLLSGFARIQTDLGDSRFNHYMLEHGYRWLLGERVHGSLWSPPFFYPVPNVGAYSDLMVGVGPVYWFWRLLGAAEDLAFGLWMVSMSALNYLAGLLLYRIGLRFGWTASAGAAALVAFGAPRVNQIGHQQLLSCFYVLVAVYALTRLAALEPMHWRLRAGYWLVAALALVAQLYSGVYLGWFLATGTLLTAAAAVCLRDCRWRLVAVVWRDAGTMIVVGALGMLLLIPFLVHYGGSAAELRTRVYWPLIVQLQPQLVSWFSMGAQNWLWGWTANHQLFSSRASAGELALGIGFLTLPVCCLGLVIGRRWPMCQLAMTLMGVVWVGTTQLPGHLVSAGALVASFYCGAGLFHERGEFVARATAVALVLIVGLFDRFPSHYVQVLMLSAIVFSLLRLMQREAVVVPLIAIAALSVVLFPLDALMYGAGATFVFWILISRLFPSRRTEIGLVLSWLLLVVVAWATLGHRPHVLVYTAVGVPVSLAVTAGRRVPVRLLGWGFAMAVPLVFLFSHGNSVWLNHVLWIPGGIAIRAIGRAVLILLIAAAVGLACVVEMLEKSRWRFTAWGLVLLCMAEQVITTESYDAALNRGRIETIAKRVERDGKSFFFYETGHGLTVHDQLDAMFASLATSVPTVNGYSGYYPRLWGRMAKIGAKDGLSLPATLEEWEREQGLLADSVQLIDGLVGKIDGDQSRGAPSVTNGSSR